MTVVRQRSQTTRQPPLPTEERTFRQNQKRRRARNWAPGVSFLSRTIPVIQWQYLLPYFEAEPSQLIHKQSNQLATAGGQVRKMNQVKLEPQLLTRIRILN